MNVAQILNYLGVSVSRQKAPFTYIGNLSGNSQAEYNALIWLDARPKPAWATIVLNEAYSDAWHHRRSLMEFNP